VAKNWIWATVVVAVAIIAVIVTLVYQKIAEPEFEPARVEEMAYPLPEEPSIVVLPFTNMSGEPEQDYFSDGFTDQVINALSKAPRLFVIARHSAFAYKNKEVEVQQVAEELGVRYVLEGSVQKAGGKIRITALLIDALTGRHLWSERYDRELMDLFALQDEIALQILSAVRVKLTEGEQARWGSGTPQRTETVLKSLEASNLVLKFNKESNSIAKRLAEEMIAEDPKSPLGYYVMAQGLFMDPYLGSTKNPKETLDKAVEMAQKAIALGAKTGNVHGALAYIYANRREYDKAIAEGKLAVQIEPSGADGIVYYGNALIFAGKAKEAIPHIEKGLRLNPYPPTWYYVNAGHAYLFIGQYEKALTYYIEAKRRGSPSPVYHRVLAAAYALIGRQDKARAEAKQLMSLAPNFSLERYAKTIPLHPTYAEIFVNALRKAGLR